MSKIRRAMYVQIAGLLAVAGLFLWLSRYLNVVDLIASAQQRVMNLGAWSALCYPLLCALCNVLLLPGGVLSIGGGFFFGLWWGFLIVLVGNVIGAALAFGISRWVGERWFKARLLQNPTLAAIEPGLQREGWKLILLTQLHPLFPTSLLNYLYGLSHLRFRTCLFWVAIGQTPGLFLYVYLGTLGQLGLNLVRGKSHPRATEYWVWGGGFFTATIILIILGRIAARLIEGERPPAETGTATVRASQAQHADINA